MDTSNKTTNAVQKTVLDNGLTVASNHMPDAQSVAIGIFVNVGSRDEDIPQAGISHALEHMVFKGAGALDVHELAESLDNLGGNANAYTSKERTCFHLHVLHEDWQTGLSLLSDMLLEPRLPEEEWQREREVIFAEMSMVDDAPDEWVFDQHAAHVYADQAMGRPVLGSRETLNQMSVQDLRDYLNMHYRGANVLIAAAGRIEHDDLLGMVQGSAWSHGLAATKKVRALPVFQSGQYDLTKPMEQAQVMVSWLGQGVKEEDKAVAWIANQLLGGSMSSLLFREVREKRGLAYGIGSFLSSYSDAGLISISCSTMPEQLQPCLAVLRETIADVCTQIPQGMVERAQRQLTVQFRMGMDAVEGSMLQLGALLDEEQLYSPLEWVDKVNAVETAQVQAWLQQYLAADAMWTLAVPE
ncbi:MAG: pitrilysin family protein [Mariprofundaceae bacterium]|nr:pitrilysin family protein [Mariprofundaceae bacterium]